MNTPMNHLRKARGMTRSGLTSVCCLILLAVSAWSPLCIAETGPPIILSAHPEFPPLMYRNGERLDGFIPKLTERVLSELGLDVQNIYVGPWARVQNDAKNGKIDMIAGIYKNDERLTYLAYVPTPVVTNSSVVFVKQGRAFPFTSWDALKGKTLGAIIGDSFPPDFEAFLAQNADTIPIERVTSVEQNFKKLLSERIDFMAYGQYVGMLVSEKMEISDQIQMLPEPISTGLVYVAFSKKSQFLKYLPEVDALIAQYKNNGTIDALIQESIKEYLEMVKEETP